MSEYNPALDQSADSDAPPRFGVGSFGQVVFQVSEEALALVRDLRRKTAARVEEHQVVGAKPRLEFIAPELDETVFKVFWSISFGVRPRTEIRRLREVCEAGVAHRLIMGGENFGKYLLTEMQEHWLRGGPGGEPIVAEAALTLKEYH